MGSDQASKTRLRFLAKFEEQPTGYLYRRSPTARPVRVSAKDYEFMVNEFDTAWLQLPFVVALAVAAICLSVWLAIKIADPPQNGYFELILLPLVAIWFVVAWWADLWDKPDQALFARAREMNRTDNLPWLTKTAGGFSWKGSMIFVFLSLSSITRHWNDELPTAADKVFYVLPFVCGMAYVLVGLRKAQLKRAPSLPYLNEVD